MKKIERRMKPQINENAAVLERSAGKEVTHKRIMIFKQLRMLRWPDLSTLLGLLCASSSAYFSFKGVFAVAYALILAQFAFDYADGKLARTFGGGPLGVYLDSFSDFISVTASVVFGWFVGIDGVIMYMAGFLNIGAAAVRLAYFTAYKQKGFTGIPTVLASALVTTIAYLGHLFAQPYIGWFVIFYYVSAVAMISDLKLNKIFS